MPILSIKVACSWLGAGIKAAFILQADYKMDKSD